ncbi:MAG: endonuclease III [Rhodospirillales bacterium]|nr:endonuclease III [Rhodospirillales bacterium]
MTTRRPSRRPGAAATSSCAIPLLNSDEVNEVYRRLAAANPEPRGELAFTDPFTLLVAVVLSAQATDASVNRACAPLFAVAPDPAAMLALGEEGLRERIKTIGLFNTKAKNVIALSRQLIERWGGVVPADREALQSLPGVGRKSANVVLNVAFGEPTIAVDTHVFRVANRTGLATGMTPEAVEQGLLARTPQRWLRRAHHWLILHGRYICQARKPRCFACPIRDVCRYPAKTDGVDLTAAGIDPLTPSPAD